MTLKTILHQAISYIKTLGLPIVYSIFEYYLGKTKKIAANSTIELLYVVSKHFFKKGNQMAFSKVLYQGADGSVIVSEDAGVVKFTAEASVALGGGSVAGALKLHSSNCVELSAAQLMDAGLALAMEKFPSIAAEIAVVKGLIDAELSKV